jgi:pilus assembly protein Flp/PilA
MPVHKVPYWGERGQGLMEYTLVVLLIAIAIIGALALLGPVIGSIFSSVKPAL